MMHYDVVVAGSGFGGSILARALNSKGLRVLLLERDRHPRFALGESSTPLAALSLERLATNYGLPDLAQLATYGRWQQSHPSLRCGLKRGFTFIDHRREAQAQGRSSLLVAASPNDRVADTHWLRADVDHHLVQEAANEGVDYREKSPLLGLLLRQSSLEIDLGRGGKVQTTTLVDATGPAAVAHRYLGSDRPQNASQPLRTRSSLLYSHFDNVDSSPLTVDDCEPYPPRAAAVHHLIEEGWMYELRFDNGTVSAGMLLRNPPPEPPAQAWRRILCSYPDLQERFREAEPRFPICAIEQLQRRLPAAHGPRWLALPHTYAFVDPLFSTGIAWTLRAVERLAELLSYAASDRATSSARNRYAELLAQEANQIDQLVSGAYQAINDFESFAIYAQTYFITVSWMEAQERLLQPTNPAWQGVLGIDDPQLATLFAEASQRLPDHPDPASINSYRDWLHRRTASRDLIGLDLLGSSLAIPADLDVLVARADKLGLDQETVRRMLPRLRGARHRVTRASP